MTVYEFMKVFGCLTYYWNTDTEGDKLEMRGKPGVFLGYLQGTKGYKILDIGTGKIIVSRDVKFYEEKFPFNNLEREKNEPDAFEPPLCDDGVENEMTENRIGPKEEVVAHGDIPILDHSLEDHGLTTENVTVAQNEDTLENKSTNQNIEGPDPITTRPK
jgi:hypothetical protein